MNLSFQNPALFGLLGLAVLPLVVHLVSRVKPPTHPFSNVDFLRKVVAYRTRFKAPKDWLLLLVRCLAVLLLMAAFLLPLLRSEKAILPGEQRNVVIVVDRSASMAAREGATTRFEVATAKAAQLLAELDADLANIVWIDSFPDSVLPEPAPNTTLLRDELLKQTPSHETGAIERAIEIASSQLVQTAGRLELHIISDFQESAWKDLQLQLPENIHVNFEAVTRTAPDNLSVDSIIATPRQPVAGQEIRVQCRVTNHSNQPRRSELTLDAGGSRQSQTLSVPAGGEAEASFRLRVSRIGMLPVTAEISGDGFPQDNQRHTVVQVRESIQLAVAAPADHPATSALSQVATALPWLDVIADATIEASPSCDILWVPEWDGTKRELLARAREKCALVLTPTRGCKAESLAEVTGREFPAHSKLKLQRKGEGWQILPDEEHDAFKLFRDGQYGNPMAGSYQLRTQVSDAGSLSVVARYNDGHPAILETRAHQTLIMLFPMDAEHSSWRLEDPFLPAIGELLLHLAPQGGILSFNGNPGEVLSWTNPGADDSAEPSLIGPGDSPIALEQRDASWISASAELPGIYQWAVSGQPVMMHAVNFPESESRLQPMASPPSAEQMAAKLAGGVPGSLDKGLPLWPWLLAAALLLLFAEHLVMAKMPGSSNKQPQAA
ncbi:MAG: BatA and WFA domain-containing protein [Akkermansiaceae bacterium]|nr:BatA and WFA domain-containing protein [Akkermansiaceae bacterium]